MTAVILGLASLVAFLYADAYRLRCRELESENQRLATELKRVNARHSAACMNAFTNGVALLATPRGPTLHDVHSHEARELVIGEGFRREWQ